MNEEEALVGPAQRTAERSTTSLASRRAVLVGAGAAAVVVLSGCATNGQDHPGGDTGADTGGDTGGGESPAGPPAPIASTSEIPVGGGTVFDQRRVVVTQPEAGTFKAFSAVCTHQGCVVAEIKDGTINCPCHGSKFKITDGSVAVGPATRALTQRDIRVEGTDITLA